MYGVDLSWPARTVAYIINYVAGLVVVLVGFAYIPLRPIVEVRAGDVVGVEPDGISAADPSSFVSGAQELGGKLIEWLPVLVVALIYVATWAKLYAYVDRLDQDEWERYPHIFSRGACAFAVGILTLYVPWLLLHLH